jgi:hypothetical protein
MTTLRVLRTSKATLTKTLYLDEVATGATGNVVVTVTRLDGTAVESGNATGPDSANQYTYLFGGRDVLDELIVSWAATVSGDAVVLDQDRLQVVGGFFFGLSEVRNELKVPVASATTAQLAAKRTEVEQECERICRRAFVPRFAREYLDGTNTERLALPPRRCEVRAVRAVSVGGVAWSAPDVAALAFSAEAGALYRPLGVIWPLGHRNIAVEWEFGWDYPPEDLKSVSMLRLRSLLPRTRSGIPERALSYTDQAGTSYRLSMPDKDSTGIPDVDGTYQRWMRPRGAVIA